MGTVKVDKSNLRQNAKKSYELFCEQQTQTLIAYAPKKLEQAFLERTFKTDTGNLSDSYVWAVWFRGALKGHGFLGGKKAIVNSRSGLRQNIDGRQDAESFIAYYPAKKTGWEMILAAVVEYGHYLEAGKGGIKKQYIVISSIFDDIVRDFSGKGTVKMFSLPNTNSI